MKRIKKYFFSVAVSLAAVLSFPVTASAGLFTDGWADVALERINAKLTAFAESNIGQLANSFRQAAETFSEINILNGRVGGLLDFTQEMYSGARAAEMSMDNIRSAVNAFYGLTEEAEMTVNELKIYTESGWLTSSEFQEHLLMVKYVVNDAGLEIRYLFNFTQGPLAPVARKSVMTSGIPAKSKTAMDNIGARINELQGLSDNAPDDQKGFYQAQIKALTDEKDALMNRASYYGDFDYTDSQGNELNVFRNEDGTLRKDWLMGEGTKDGVITGLLKTVESRTEEIRQIAGRMQSRTEFLSDQRALLMEDVKRVMSIEASNAMGNVMSPHVVEKDDADSSAWKAFAKEFNSRHQAKTDEDARREKIEKGKRIANDPNLTDEQAEYVAELNEGLSGYTTSVTDKNEAAEEASRDLKLSSNGIFTIIYVLLGIMAIFFGVQVVIKMNKGEKQSQDTMFKLLTGTLAAIIIITLFREILF